MGDGRIDRAIRQGKARSTGIRSRVPELTDELRTRGGELARHYAEIDVSWARCDAAKAAREALLNLGLGTLINFYVRKRAVGRGVFDTLEHPVIFVANHSSHLDTPVILRAMPRKWRTRTAVAAAADYFYDSRWKARGVALLFNTVPIGRQGGGLGEGATDHVDRLIDEGWNLVMFPEGTRSRNGQVGRVRSGAAVIAASHDIDIVPIYVRGTHEAMPPGQGWPRRIPGRFLSRRHDVEVRFGQPIRPRDVDHRHEAMNEVRAYWERKGMPKAPEPPAARRFNRAASTPQAAAADRSTTAV